MPDSNTFDSVQVFSATKHQEREKLGATITDWIRGAARVPGFAIVDKVVSLSSDSEFHCLAITIFYRAGVAK